LANSTEKQYRQNTPMKGRVFRPLIQVSFHTEQRLFHAKSVGINIYGEEINPNNEVLSVTTQKTLSSPAGFWTMNLAGLQWAGVLKPQDLVVIQMGYAGEATFSTVMVGLIDKVNRKKSMGGDGKPQTTTTVTGRDFGKLFVKDLLKFYPEISGKNASDFFLTDVGWINLMKIFTTDNIMKGTPASIIWNIMQHIFPKLHNTSWTLWDEMGDTPKSRKVTAQNLVYSALGKTNFFMPFIFTADQYEGALWNLLERASPKPFTELFIDCRDSSEYWRETAKDRLIPHDIEQLALDRDATNFRFGKDHVRITLCMRQTPYDSALRNNLVRHKIPQEDVISEDLGCSDEQHYNLFWAGTSINPLGIDLKRVAPPLLNEANATKYGLAPLEVSIEGMEMTDSLVLEGMSKTYTGKLKTWFENNHNYFSGSLEIRGKADIRVGQMIEYGNQFFINEYYVEGVSHTFTVFQGWTTSLTLTRGMPIGTVVDSSPYVWSPPVPPPPPSAPPTPPVTYYTVVKGDTLWHIAKRKYNDPLKWRKIWEANKAMLIARDRRNATDHGHWIFPGQKLTIPA
jgi:LysM domain